MKTTMIPLLVFVAVATCHARLGETLEQSIVRYGKPVDAINHPAPDCAEAIFHVGHFEVTADFYKDVCTELSIVKGAPVSPGSDVFSPEVLSQEEAAAIVAQNADGSAWGAPVIDDVQGSSAYAWTRQDGAVASWMTGLPLVSIRAQVNPYREAAAQGAARKEAQGL